MTRPLPFVALLAAGVALGAVGLGCPAEGGSPGSGEGATPTPGAGAGGDATAGAAGTSPAGGAPEGGAGAADAKRGSGGAATGGGMIGAAHAYSLSPAARYATPSIVGGRDDLVELVGAAQRRGRDQRYLVPTRAEVAEMRAIVRELVPRLRRAGAVDVDDLDERAGRLGLQLVKFRSLAGSFVIVRELEGLERGAGILVLRGGDAPRPLAVMAPHCFEDDATGRMALRFFLETDAAALLLNTVRRDAPVLNPSELGGMERPADLAFAERSFFLAATEALAAAHERAAFVQLHGWEHEECPEVGAEVAAVLSRGNAYLSEDLALDRLVDELRALVGDEAAVARFGREVRALGGTNNVPGGFINAYSDDRFYHLAFDRSLRARLEDDALFRRNLATSLRRLSDGG